VQQHPQLVEALLVCQQVEPLLIFLQVELVHQLAAYSTVKQQPQLIQALPVHLHVQLIHLQAPDFDSI
jgi:hypothetical protein